MSKVILLNCILAFTASFYMFYKQPVKEDRIHLDCFSHLIARWNMMSIVFLSNGLLSLATLFWIIDI